MSEGVIVNEWTFVEEARGGLESVLQQAPLEHTSFEIWLAELLREKNMRKSEVIKRSKLNPTFAYQILSGSRKASRNKLLQLAFGMELNIPQTCALLERGGTNGLDPHNRRDVIIAFCRARGATVPDCDETLRRAGEAPLHT